MFYGFIWCFTMYMRMNVRVQIIEEPTVTLDVVFTIMRLSPIVDRFASRQRFHVGMSPNAFKHMEALGGVGVVYDVSRRGCV